MLSSISTKSPNPKWLDHLHHPNSIQKPQTPVHKTTPKPQSPTPKTPPFLGDVLAHLFAFGPEPSNLPSKKHPRKIPNPKCHKVANFTNSDLNLRVLHSDRKNKNDADCSDEEKMEKGGVGEEEEEKMDLDLCGFSRTEVTVIDTSCKVWKFEKVLFRKKSVWKVRDRKSKGMSFERNDKMKMKMKMKRKPSVDEEEEEEKEVGVCRKKKKKKMVSGECSLGKRGDFSIGVKDELRRKLRPEEEDQEDEEVGVCKKKKKRFFGQCSSTKEG